MDKQAILNPLKLPSLRIRRKLLAMTVCFFLFSSPIFADQLSNRIVTISAQFLGKPYQLHPLDEKILYRFDKFDCETYVDTVLALALSNNNQKAFEKNMVEIRYSNGVPNYYTRNHFPDADWIPNNIKKDYIQYSDLDTDKISIVVDKKLFFKDNAITNPTVTLPYISSQRLPSVINQIPNGSIVFIVKPTFLLISHMGFAIWKDNVLYLREASSIYHKVMDVPLLPYIQSDADIKGISVVVAVGQVVAPATT